MVAFHEVVTFLLLGAAILLAATPVRAARVFFSFAGSPDQTVCRPTVGEVPVLVLFPGDPASLYLWITPDGVWDPADPGSRQAFRSVSFDLETFSGIASVTGFDMANPFNAGVQSPRWDAVSDGFPTKSTRFPVENTFGIANNAPGIGNTSPNHSPYALDAGYDPATRSFFLGRMDLIAQGPGQSAVYLRTGDTGNFLVDGGPAPLQFGGDMITYFDDPQNPGGRGDPITADLRHADALITVSGAPEIYEFIATSRCRSDLFFYDPDFSDRRFRSLPESPQFLLSVESLLAAQRGDLTLYVDLTYDSTAEQLLANLEGSDFVVMAARSDFMAPNADMPGLSTADVVIHLNLDNFGDVDRFLEARFPPVSALLLVPEPGTLRCAVCGIVFILGIPVGRAWRKKVERTK